MEDPNPPQRARGQGLSPKKKFPLTCSAYNGHATPKGKGKIYGVLSN